MTAPGAPVPPTPDVLAGRIEQVWDRVAAAGGDPSAIRLVAVTKGFDGSFARACGAAGLDDLGENYAQELAAKAAELAAEGTAVRWHAIGQLQRNKVRSLAGLVQLWQSVDRLSLGREIARRSPGAEVLVQVNVSEEPQKGGCVPGDAPALIGELTDEGLSVQGLMTVGRAGRPEDARAGFTLLSRLADQLDLPVRSMGMSGDYEVAVAEGATMVRIGSALLGPRPERPRSPVRSR